MRISDWSSDVCSSDLRGAQQPCRQHHPRKTEKTPESELLAACHRLPIGKQCHGCTSLEQAMLRRSESKPRRAEAIQVSLAGRRARAMAAKARTGGRVVYGSGLENRRRGHDTVGSDPTTSPRTASNTVTI